jgi:hypothetical protein
MMACDALLPPQSQRSILLTDTQRPQVVQVGVTASSMGWPFAGNYPHAIQRTM